MIERLSSGKNLSLLIFVFAWGLFSLNIGGTTIYILDEAKNAECAREMLERADWIVPTFNQELRTDKPPLHYFFMMLSYRGLGVTPFAARLFSSLFGALTVLIIYLFAKKYTDRQTAFISATVLLASVLLCIQFHLAVPDPYLVFFMTASILSFFLFLESKNRLLGLALYSSIGLGTLSKGPVAIALPVLIFLLHLIFTKQLNWKTIANLKPFIGSLIVLAIALPWYILAHIKTQGAWTEGFFLQHNLARFTGEMEGHGGTFIATILFVLVGLFPFSVYLPQSIREALKHRKNHFTSFLLTAGLAIVGFFMLSKTRLPNYTVPALPYFAILIALFIKKKLDAPKSLRIGLIVILTISLLLVPGIIVAFHLDPSLSAVNHIGWFFIPFPLLIIAATIFLYQGKTEHSLAITVLGGVITSLIFFVLAFPAIDRQNPVAQSMSKVNGKEIRYFKKFNAAFPFNLERVIPEITAGEIDEFFEQHPEGVIISTENKIKSIDLPEEAEVSLAVKDLFESPTTVLITKKKR